jgi:ATP diphosphatase
MATGIERLLKIMAQLRDPESGCPWDIEQTYQTIVPYTIEETYEVVDAIEREDFEDLKQELGDLLFQVVFYCRIAEEEGRFDFYDVVDTVSEKLTTRHPHVFSNVSFASEDELHRAWENQKHKERKAKDQKASLLDDIPKQFPALIRAQKVQKRAAKQGFDWPNIDGVWRKLEEEIEELKQELQHQPRSQTAIEDEFGDVLFTLVNLARFLKVDSESSLRRATHKFEYRFRSMEHNLAQRGVSLESLTLAEMEHSWEQAKRDLNQPDKPQKSDEAG